MKQMNDRFPAVQVEFRIFKFVLADGRIKSGELNRTGGNQVL